ncbi:MAG: hypothetical protein ACK4SM_05025, partial [Aquificaceae bacterium]
MKKAVLISVLGVALLASCQKKAEEAPSAEQPAQPPAEQPAQPPTPPPAQPPAEQPQKPPAEQPKQESTA